jgi:hypothetical protein
MDILMWILTLTVETCKIIPQTLRTLFILP